MAPLPNELLIDIIAYALDPNFSFRPLFPSKSKPAFKALDGFSRSCRIFRYLLKREWFRTLYLRRDPDWTYLTPNSDILPMVQALRLETWPRAKSAQALLVSFTEVTALSIEITAIYEAEADVDLREELVNFAAHFDVRNISTLDINVWTAIYKPGEEEFHDYISPVEAITAAFPYLMQLHIGGGEFEILNTINLDIVFPIPDHYGIVNGFANSLGEALSPLTLLEEVIFGLYLHNRSDVDASRTGEHQEARHRIRHRDCTACSDSLALDTDERERLASAVVGKHVANLRHIEWYFYFRDKRRFVTRRWALTDGLSQPSQASAVHPEPQMIVVGGMEESEQDNYDRFRNQYVQ